MLNNNSIAQISAQTDAQKSAKPHYSDKQCEATLKITDILLEGSFYQVEILEELIDSAEHGKAPIDPQILHEIEDMHTTINRLLYMAQSQVKHVQAMNKIEETAAKNIENRKMAAAEKKAAHVA